METLTPLLEALQALELPTFLRLSDLAYPLVNASHIMGLALLFGAIVTLDLRLLGIWRSVPLDAAAHMLLPVAVFGLITALITGTLLFSVHAVKYASLDIFQVKLALIAAAIINAVLLSRMVAWRTALDGTGATRSVRLRMAAFVSILLWSGVILSGRMIAYSA